MKKAKEISALWSQIKPQIGELVSLCHEMESHYEVTADAYQRGYEAGLNDAWEAARKIADMPYGEEEKVFGSDGWTFIANHTAQETIEEIRAYEKAQKEIEERAQKEEEKSISAEEVMRQYLYTFCKGHGCGECVLYTSDFTCGRGYHFLTNRVSDEEVRRAYAEVLQKMKEKS